MIWELGSLGLFVPCHAIPSVPFPSPQHRPPLSLQFSFLSVSLFFLHCTKSDGICIYISIPALFSFFSSSPLFSLLVNIPFCFLLLLVLPATYKRWKRKEKQNKRFKTNKVLNSDSNAADNFCFWVPRIHVLRGDSSIIGLFGLPGFFFFFFGKFLALLTL